MAHVERQLTQLSGIEVTQREFLNIAAFAAPIAWLLGATLSLKRWAFGYFLMSTFLFGTMFGELSHFFSSLLEDGTFHYTPGMYTAAPLVFSGWATFLILLREVKKQQRVAKSPGNSNIFDPGNLR